MKQIKAILHWFAFRNGHNQEVLSNFATRFKDLHSNKSWLIIL